jgi:hypothetical protein
MNVLNDVVIRIRELNKKRNSSADVYLPSTTGTAGSFTHSFLSDTPSLGLIDVNINTSLSHDADNINTIIKK